MPNIPVNESAHRFLTPEEVSELLQVSVFTVRRWIKQDELPAYKLGRLWRIKRSDLNQWLSQQRAN